MSGRFKYSLYITEVGEGRSQDLRLVLARLLRGAGKTILTGWIKRVRGGESVLVYQTNDARDAEDKADIIRRGGGQVKIAGL